MGGRVRDIEGLRAVAVVSVLLYHAGFGFPGGYVGVDVFFVVSGFLITGLLLAEREMTGRISLSAFWGRRARRLLPAATVVLVATMALAVLVLDPVARRRLSADAAHSAAFLANVRFATTGQGYFGAEQAPSVLQHWWSLAVEEQFYLVWPVVLALLWRFRPGRRTLVSFASVVVVVSLAVSVWLVDRGSVWGYYGLHSRAWELAVGGLLAAVLGKLGPAGTGRALVGWAGIAAIVCSMFLYDDTTTFPGVAAMLPVVGTCAVFLAIGARRGPGIVLATSPLQWVGGRSYSLYLWHWPLLVLAGAQWGEDRAIVRVAALAAAVALSAVSFRWVENPVRHAARLVHSARASLLVGGAFVIVAVGGSGVLHALSGESRTGVVADTVPAPQTLPSASSTTVPTADGLLSQFATQVKSVLAPVIEKSLSVRLAPDNLRPSIAGAPDDKVSIFGDQCMASFSRTNNPPCEFAATESSSTVVLFGDSHAAQWFTPLEKAAREENLRLVALTKMGCPATWVSVRRDAKRDYPECDTWRPLTVRRIADSDAKLVVISNYAYHPKGKPKGHFTNAEWADGLGRTVKALRDAGKNVLVLSDTPVPGTNVPECLAANTRRVDRCARPRASSINAPRIARERAVVESLGGLYVETTDLACASACPAVIGDMVTYLDSNHLTSTYAGSLAPYVKLLLRAGLLAR